jgi:hypothetical protein
MLTPAKTILFLAADPTDAGRLRLGEEVRGIHERLQRSSTQDLVLAPRFSVRAADVTQALFDTKPSVVHFSGHGTQAGALCLEADDGRTHPVTAEALDHLFELCRDTVKCVVLNACSTEPQARAIASHIDYVIGMRRPIGDAAAIAFAAGFYKALAAGRTVTDSFKFGVVELRLLNIPEHDTPVLYDHSRTGDVAASLSSELASVPRPPVGDGPDRRAAEQPETARSEQRSLGRPSSALDTAHAAPTSTRGVEIQRDAVGNVIVTGDSNKVDAEVTATNNVVLLPDPGTVNVAKELVAIRALLTSLDSEHAKTIARALDDADDAAGAKSKEQKNEVGEALDRALRYATTASVFTTLASSLSPHLRNVVAWLGSGWTALLRYVA